jgi:hypothetical protein
MAALFRYLKQLIYAYKFWLYLYIFKAVMALLIVIPLFLILNTGLSRSDLSQSLLARWDMTVILEILAGRGEVATLYMIFILIGVVIYTLLMQFVNGGLYYTVVSGSLKTVDKITFFSECGTGFLINLKITLFMLIVYALFLSSGLFFVNLIGMMGQNLIGAKALVLLAGKTIILFIIMLAVSIFSDSCRGAAAANPDKPFREILKKGSAYFKPNLLSFMAVFIITFIPFIIFWLVVEWMALGVSGLSIGIIGVLIEFILFQVSSVFRTGQKLWYLLSFGHSIRKFDPGRFIPQQSELKLE